MAQLFAASALQGVAKTKLSARRRDYSVKFKRAICRIAQENPQLPQAKLISRITEELGAEVPQSTLSRILRDHERWLTANVLERRRLRSGRHAEMEEALLAWAHHWLDHAGVITYALLQSQAAQLGARLGVTDFTYSTGWVWRFCERAGLTVRKRVGEAASASMASVELARTAIPSILATLGARPEQVFNCDETGVIFGAQPCKTLAFGRVQGVKRQMERVTLMFCVNSTGSDKLKPMIICKPKRPQCFGRQNAANRFEVEDYMSYFSHPAAWTTRSIFNTWLARLQCQLEQENRVIFLLLDNCSAHTVTLEPQTTETMNGVKVCYEAFMCRIVSYVCFMFQSVFHAAICVAQYLTCVTLPSVRRTAICVLHCTMCVALHYVLGVFLSDSLCSDIRILPCVYSPLSSALLCVPASSHLRLCLYRTFGSSTSPRTVHPSYNRLIKESCTLSKRGTGSGTSIGSSPPLSLIHHPSISCLASNPT